MINYSLIKGSFTRKDLINASKFSEAFFHTADNPFQMPEKELTYKFFTKHFPLSTNIIYDKNKVIGHTFVLPCDKKNMICFLKGKITEKELFYLIKDSIPKKQYSCLYFVSSLIKPKYRRKGYTMKARIMQIKEYQKILGKNLTLFSWPFSKEGYKFGKKLAKKLKLKILFKKY